MGLFGNKKPKLPSYVGARLDQLLQDPQWAYAIDQAGVDPNACEVVLLLQDATVGQGRIGGAPQNATPAILFGQGNTLAMAFPAEREVTVVSRPTSRAELQTQRSGWFQILFGPAENLDGFMFWGSDDNLNLSSPEGEKFGQIMSAFLKGQLKPQQIVGTPQSLVAGSVSVEPPAPAFDDPDDALRWRMINSLSATLAAMLDKNTQCFEKAEMAEKAFAMGNAEFVDGIRQHEISREHFHNMGVTLDGEVVALLHELREVTAAAQAQWRDLVFLLPASDNDVLAIANWCTSRGVDSGLLSAIVSNGMFINTDFGLTRESFWAENERVAAVLKGAGQ